MKLTDTSLLLLITVVVFFAMYIGAILFQGKGFLKPQTFFKYFKCKCCPDYYFLWHEPCDDYRWN